MNVTTWHDMKRNGWKKNNNIYKKIKATWLEKYVTGIQRGTETMQCVYMYIYNYIYIYTGVKYILFIHSSYLSTFARALDAFAYCVCGADECTFLYWFTYATMFQKGHVLHWSTDPISSCRRLATHTGYDSDSAERGFVCSFHIPQWLSILSKYCHPWA